MQNLLGFIAPFLIYAYIFLLNVLLPGRWVTGYVTKEGTDEKLRYNFHHPECEKAQNKTYSERILKKKKIVIHPHFGHKENAVDHLQLPYRSA